MRQSKADKLLDRKVEESYYRTCSGVQVNIMDIPSIFREGRKALAEGRDLDSAIVAYVATIRKN